MPIYTQMEDDVHVPVATDDYVTVKLEDGAKLEEPVTIEDAVVENATPDDAPKLDEDLLMYDVRTGRTPSPSPCLIEQRDLLRLFDCCKSVEENIRNFRQVVFHGKSLVQVDNDYSRKVARKLVIMSQIAITAAAEIYNNQPLDKKFSSLPDKLDDAMSSLMDVGVELKKHPNDNVVVADCFVLSDAFNLRCATTFLICEFITHTTYTETIRWS